MSLALGNPNPRSRNDSRGNEVGRNELEIGFGVWGIEEGVAIVGGGDVERCGELARTGE